MRLIDADKLNFEDVDFYSPDSCYEVDKVIDDVPTVKAIAIIPEGSTNGDVIKAVFPSAEIDENKYTYVVCVKLPYHTQYDTGLLFDKDWWNSPYKECEKG